MGCVSSSQHDLLARSEFLEKEDKWKQHIFNSLPPNPEDESFSTIIGDGDYVYMTQGIKEVVEEWADEHDYQIIKIRPSKSKKNRTKQYEFTFRLKNSSTM